MSLFTTFPGDPNPPGFGQGFADEDAIGRGLADLLGEYSGPQGDHRTQRSPSSSSEESSDGEEGNDFVPVDRESVWGEHGKPRSTPVVEHDLVDLVAKVVSSALASVVGALEKAEQRISQLEKRLQESEESGKKAEEKISQLLGKLAGYEEKGKEALNKLDLMESAGVRLRGAKEKLLSAYVDRAERAQQAAAESAVAAASSVRVPTPREAEQESVTLARLKLAAESVGQRLEVQISAAEATLLTIKEGNVKPGQHQPQPETVVFDDDVFIPADGDTPVFTPSNTTEEEFVVFDDLDPPPPRQAPPDVDDMPVFDDLPPPPFFAPPEEPEFYAD